MKATGVAMAALLLLAFFAPLCTAAPACAMPCCRTTAMTSANMECGGHAAALTAPAPPSVIASSPVAIATAALPAISAEAPAASFAHRPPEQSLHLLNSVFRI